MKFKITHYNFAKLCNLELKQTIYEYNDIVMKTVIYFVTFSQVFVK